MFKEEMHTSKGLYGYFFKFILDEFGKILKEENPDIWKFILDNHIGVKVKECYTAEQIADDVMQHKGHLRKDAMRQMLMNWRCKEETSGFQIRANWVFTNNKLRISGFMLEVSVPNLCMNICNKVYDLEKYKEEILWDLHHEVGHMIDYIHNRNDISLKEWQDTEDAITQNYDKYYKDTNKPIASTEQRDEYNIMYYELPNEKAANDAVGISIKDMIEFDREWDKRYHNKLVTIAIDQNGIRDVPPPEEKDDNK